MSRISQIKKEIERLEKEMKVYSDPIKELKQALAICMERDKKNEIRKELDVVCKKKDALKSDWYLMLNELKQEEEKLEKASK